MGIIELAKQAIDFVLHVDRYLNVLVQNYGIGVYFILFLVVFVETGLVLMPFLPGDSLIFISGTLAGAGILKFWVLFFVFFFAAVIGDTVNYWLGYYLGKKVFEKSRLFNEEYLHRTEVFYTKHGRKTIFFARFIPIIRTFAPFVAGIGKMEYKRFFLFNIIGALVWVPLFLVSGYYLGNVPLVRDNLVIVTLLIIIISFIPPIIEYIKHKRRKSKAKKAKK
jgi:membrane-associated protein